MTFNFSKEQSLIIHMLADLALKPEQRELDAAFISKAVAYGHTWAIDWRYDGMFGEADTPADVNFVTDVLDMWRFIEGHYGELDEAGREKVEAIAGAYAGNPRFSGFDGNNEIGLMSIARFMVDEMGRFAEFRGREFNSHSPKIDRYRRMLAVFLPLRPSLADRNLTGEEIGAILRHD